MSMRGGGDPTVIISERVVCGQTGKARGEHSGMTVVCASAEMWPVQVQPLSRLSGHPIKTRALTSYVNVTSKKKL